MFNMFNIIPTDTIFFDLLEKSSQNLVEISQKMQELLGNLDQSAEIVYEIGKIEEKGDQIEQETLDRLSKSFVTPLDREDIHAICKRLDDVADAIYSIADRLLLLGIREIPAEYRALLDIIDRCAQVTAEIIAYLRLKKYPEIMKGCHRLDKLQDEYRRHKRSFLQDLFRDGQDPLYALKWKDLLDVLSRAIHRIADTASILNEVSLKHG